VGRLGLGFSVTCSVTARARVSAMVTVRDMDTLGVTIAGRLHLRLGVTIASALNKTINVT